MLLPSISKRSTLIRFGTLTANNLGLVEAIKMFRSELLESKDCFCPSDFFLIKPITTAKNQLTPVSLYSLSPNRVR